CGSQTLDIRRAAAATRRARAPFAAHRHFVQRCDKVSQPNMQPRSRIDDNDDLLRATLLLDRALVLNAELRGETSGEVVKVASSIGADGKVRPRKTEKRAPGGARRFWRPWRQRGGCKGDGRRIPGGSAARTGAAWQRP
ncbi:MAG TPA: hypothetical protein VF814_19955, partial [Casimicrobiaceae bacterium]